MADLLTIEEKEKDNALTWCENSLDAPYRVTHYKYGIDILFL